MGSLGRAGRLLASLLLFFAGACFAPKAAAAFKNVQGGMEAPAFRLMDVGGNEVSLDAYKKEKAVVLVFFAVWSSRSLEELKDVQKLLSGMGPLGLKAIAVNVEHEQMTEQDQRAVRDKVAELKLTFPVVFDRGLETFREYGVVAVPSTAILGEGGQVRNAFNGYPTFAFAELKEQVETLLGMKKAGETATAAGRETAHKPNRVALLNYNLGRRLYRSGMADKAEPKLKTAAGADPDWAAPHILLGEIHLARGKKDPKKLEEARKEFEAAVAAEKGNVVARTGLARVYLKTGATPDAEREVGEALKTSPSYPPALLLSAAVLARKGNLPEAEKRIRSALELSPRDAEAHALAGSVFEGAGELRKAAEMYRKAWQLGGE
jgi:tetratricopeptide (TPR) repeat protein